MSEELKIGDVAIMKRKPGYWRVTEVRNAAYHPDSVRSGESMLHLEPVLMANGKRATKNKCARWERSGLVVKATVAVLQQELNDTVAYAKQAHKAAYDLLMKSSTPESKE